MIVQREQYVTDVAARVYCPCDPSRAQSLPLKNLSASCNSACVHSPTAFVDFSEALVATIRKEHGSGYSAVCCQEPRGYMLHGRGNTKQAEKTDIAAISATVAAFFTVSLSVSRLWPLGRLLGSGTKARNDINLAVSSGEPIAQGLAFYFDRGKCSHL